MRFYLSLWTAKIISLIVRIFHLGAGHAWAGHIALKIYPNLLSDKKVFFKKGIVLISGTNGKTTTSKLTSHMLAAQGLKVLSNSTGANLLNGLAASILLNMSWGGISDADVAVFEVDEFNLPVVLNQLQVSIIALLNLSRDQLDRYGETDTIFERWKESFATLNEDAMLVLDAQQPEFKELPNIFKGRIFYFSAPSNVVSSLVDPGTVVFESDSYIHLTNLHGNFNVKNINTALLICVVLGFDKDLCVKSLATFESAYGRGEIITKNDHKFFLFLAKNPASYSENLNALLNTESVDSTKSLEFDSVLCILNDGIPDGRDVSWIYDVNPELIVKSLQDKRIFVSGTRCLDMAIRLQYAGLTIAKEDVDADIASALSKIFKLGLAKTIVLPNYSAMLGIRKLLVGRSIL